MKGALLGAGSFGQVFLGLDAQSGVLMAVKQVELGETGSGHGAERRKGMIVALEREIELLKDLQHEHIVQYLGAYRAVVVMRPILATDQTFRRLLHRRPPPQYFPGIRSRRNRFLPLEQIRPL